MESSCRLQSGLRWGFWDWLTLAGSQPSVPTIVLGVDLPDLPKRSTYRLSPGQPTPGRPNLLRPPIALTRGTGILTSFPSTTAFALALGADSPCAD